MNRHLLASLALRLAKESSKRWAPMVLSGGALGSLSARGEGDPVPAAFLRNGRNGMEHKRGGECRPAGYRSDGGAVGVRAANGKRPNRRTAPEIGTTRSAVSD